MITLPSVRPGPCATRPRVGVRAALVVAALAGPATAGCGLPVDETVQRYDPGDLPANLANTTTTTTTTTTTVPATTPSESTPPAESTTTTLDAPATAPVTIYYTIGLSPDLQPLSLERIAPVPIETVIDLLESPSGISEYGLRSSVRFGLIDDTDLERGTLTVTLDAPTLERMSTSEERRAISQIVLTLTSFQPANQGNIGFVRFEVDGEGYPVYVPAFGGTSDGVEPLAFTDFASLIVGGAFAPATTTVPAPPVVARPPVTTTVPVDGSTTTTTTTVGSGTVGSGTVGPGPDDGSTTTTTEPPDDSGADATARGRSPRQ